MKISPASQVAEVDYELRQRASVYPRLAAKEPRRQAELDMHVKHMEAVRETLVWLQENEARIKAAINS